MTTLLIIVAVLAFCRIPTATSLQLRPRRPQSTTGTSLNTEYPVSILRPPSLDTASATTTSALIFLPGCFVQPHQYEPLLRKIQHKSKTNLVVAIPKLPLGAADPMLVKDAIRRSFRQLKREYLVHENQQVFLGGHSLGSAFLPEFIEDFQEDIAGLILVSAFPQRNATQLDSLPTLTVCGDLDGLKRTSRIAETYHHFFAKNDKDESKVKHPVVLIEGMVR